MEEVGKRERKPTSRFNKADMVDTSDRSVSFAHSRAHPLKKRKKVAVAEAVPGMLFPFGRIIIKGGVDAVSPAAASASGAAKGGRGRGKKDVAAAAANMPTMTPKERDANEREEFFINQICKSSIRRRRRDKEVPEGSRENITAAQAIEQSVKDCTKPLLDWSNPRAKLIGYTIKMYFEGDMVWYRGRIINYDEQSRRHFVHFDSDETAEWISLQEETVLVGTEICAMRRAKTSKGYPAIRYWCSELAVPVMQTIPGWKKSQPQNNQYVEYFDPVKSFDQMEHEFVCLSQLYPLEPPHIPEKPSKDLAARMACAEEERSRVDGIVSKVIAEIRRSLGTRDGAAPEDWIGVRVRLSTHRILPRGASIREHGGFMKCLGTVADFCSGTGKHLVIFDEEFLQPQWTTLSRDGETEYLIGPDIPEPPASFQQYLARQQQHDCCCVCRMIGAGAGEQQQEEKEELSRCEDCQTPFHPHCVPPYEEAIRSALIDSYRGACDMLFQSLVNKCMRCVRCSSCEDCLWNTPLAVWTLRRCDSVAPDSPKLYCGSCIYKYKHLRDFCSVCFKTYDRDEYPADVPISHSSHRLTQPSPLDSSANDVADNSADSGTPMDISQPSQQSGEDAWGAIVDSQMVQCNQCDRWVHSTCEGLDQEQYEAICAGYHPVWGAEYLCPRCRVDINQGVVAQIRAQDIIFMFAEPVSEALAPDYYDKIRNPMDLQTMDNKAAHGLYKSLQSMRQDVELMCLNAVLFNKTGDEYYCHAIDFHDACMVVFDSLERKTNQTAFGAEMAEITREWREKQMALITAARANKRSKWDDAVAVDDQQERSRRARRAPPSIISASADATGIAAALPSSPQVADAPPDAESSQPTTQQRFPSADSAILADNIDVSPEDAALQLILPRELRRCPDPETYFPVSATMLSADEAFYSCFVDQCLLCGSSGLGDAFLFCIDCGEACHSFCADAPLLTMSEQSRRHWRCSNCKVCELCGSADSAAGELMYCEHCDQAFHESCVTPRYEKGGLHDAPGDFFCHNCVDCETCLKKGSAWGMSGSGCQRCYEQWVLQGDLMMAEDALSTLIRQRACKICRCELGDAPSVACSLCGLRLHLDCGRAYTGSWVPVHERHFCCPSCLPGDSYHIPNAAAALSAEGGDDSRLSAVLGGESSELDLILRIALIQRRRILNRWGSVEAVPAPLLTGSGNSYGSSNHLSHLLVKCATLWLHSAVSEYLDSKGQQLGRYPDGEIRPNILHYVVTGWWSKHSAAMLKAAQEFVTLFRRYEFNETEVVDPFVSVVPPATPRPIQSSAAASSSSLPVTVATTTATNTAATPPLGLGLGLAAADAPSAHIGDPNPNPNPKFRLTLNRSGNHSFLQQCLELDGSKEMPAAELNRVASLAANLCVIVCSNSEVNVYAPHLLPLSGSARLLGPVVAEAVRAFEDDGSPCSSSDALSVIAADSSVEMLRKYLVRGEQLEDTAAAATAARVEDTAAPPAEDDSSKVVFVSRQTLCLRRALVVALMEAAVERSITPVAAAPTDKAGTLRKSSSKGGATTEQLASQQSRGGSSSKAVVPFRAVSTLATATQPQALAGAFPPLDTPPPAGAPLPCIESYYSRKARLQFPSVSYGRRFADQAEKLAGVVRGIAENLVSLNRFAVSARDAEVAAIEIARARQQERARDDAEEALCAAELSGEAAAMEAEEEPDPISVSDFTVADATAASADSAAEDVVCLMDVVGTVDEVAAVTLTDDSPLAEPSLLTSEPSLLTADEGLGTGRRQRGRVNYTEPVRVKKEKPPPAAAAADDGGAKKPAPSRSSRRGGDGAGEVIEVDIHLDEGNAPVSAEQLLALDSALLALRDGEEQEEERRAIRGWKDGFLGPEYPWVDLRVCSLCREVGEDAVTGHMLQYSDGPYVHSNCIRWSHEVVERCEGKRLENALSARHRGTKVQCYLCKQRGGTLNCNACAKSFHLKCALAFRCLLIEACLECDSASDGPHDIYTLVYCPQHHEEATSLSRRAFNWQHNLLRETPLDVAALADSMWVPSAPLRGLVLDETDKDTGSEPCRTVLPQELSRRGAERAVKSGALTVLSIGRTSQDLRGFHTEDHIFPLEFKSARLFWSMCRPLHRTLYVFDILHSDSLSGEEADVEGGADVAGPVFRVTVADDRSVLMLSRSIEGLYASIIAAVQKSIAAFAPPTPRRSLSGVYGLNAYQFFGLALPPVRHAIEMVPDSVAAMFALPPEVQYKPSFKLPTELDVIRTQQKQMLATVPNRVSFNGCARADEIETQVTLNRGRRVTRILAKAVDEEAERGEADELPDPDTLSESKRQQELNQFHYQQLAAAYLRNPYERLEVKKSHIHGWGLFARCTFEKDDMIVEYIGQKIRQAVADRREALYEEEGVGSCYLFRLDKDDIIDATRTGGMARFINHCCEPNAYARTVTVEHPGGAISKHIVIFAARDILETEEITYDYKFPIEETKLKCYCGATRCKTYLN